MICNCVTVNGREREREREKREDEKSPFTSLLPVMVICNR